jgi:hypothetical protein
MQNDSSKFTLSSLANEFLNASYIRLVTFLSISFKYYFFNFFNKEKILGKEKIGKRNTKKNEMAHKKSAATCVFFFFKLT